MLCFQALIAAAVDTYGGVDVLVNNAGQGLHAPVMDIALDDLMAVTELNFYAPLVAMQAVVPVMRERGGGSIVNASSGTTLMLPTGGRGDPRPRPATAESDMITGAAAEGV